MSDVHYVRNVSNDTSGTQFEIHIRKTQVYVCPSREECVRWIQALQKAMAIKGSRRSQENVSPIPTSKTSSGKADDQDIYSEISDTGTSCQSSSKLSNGLTQPGIQSVSNLENVYSSPQDSVDNVYSDLPEDDNVNGAMGKGVSDGAVKKPALPPPRSPANIGGKNENVYDECQQGNDKTVTASGGHSASADGASTDNVYYDAVSTGSKSVNGVSFIGDVYADGVSTSITGGGSTAGKVSAECNSTAMNVKAGGGVSSGGTNSGRFIKKPITGQRSLSPKPCRKAPPVPQPPSMITTSKRIELSNTAENSEQSDDDVINSEDQLMGIFDAMDVDSEVHDLPYVITNEDAKPVWNLKTFLRQNDVHCRVSMNRLSHSQDPVASCKVYLSTIEK